MTALLHTGRLLRLYWAQERSQFQWVLYNAVLQPGIMCYLGLRVAGESLTEQVWWISGALTMGLGMTAVSQTGFGILSDRFTGRLMILRSAPIPKLAYYLAHVGLAVAESVVLIVVGLSGLRLLGLAPLTPTGLLAGVLAAVCAGSALGGLGAVIATRAPDFPAGGNRVATAGIGLSFVSPVFWDAAALPGWLQPVTWISPFTHVAPVVRAVVADSALPLGALGGTVLFAVLFNLVSFRFVKWQG